MAAVLAGGQGAPVRATRLADWRGRPGLEAEWQSLLERADGSVFQSLPWQLAWWQAFGAGREQVAVIAECDGRLVGAAPFMVVPGSGGRELWFIGAANFASDYCDLVVDPAHPEAVDALLACALASAAPLARIAFSQLPAHSPNRARILEFLARRGYRVRTGTDQLAPARRFGDAAADRQAANKTSLKRHTRRLQQAGNVTFIRASDEAVVLRHLDDFFELHVARWAGTGTQSQFLDPAQRGFYRALARRLAPTGMLRFDAVLLDGRMVAGHFGFQHRRRFTWYKPAFDAGLAAQAPGEVLLKRLLEQAIEDGLEEFDFTVGAEAYKFRFANRVREVGHVTGHASAADYWRECTIDAARTAWRRLRGRDAATQAARAAARGLTIGDGAT